MSAAVDIPPQFEIVDRPLDTQMTISMGPQHPSTHGVLRLELVLDGEMVVKCTPDIGYLHTGMEKLFEYRKYQQGIVITDRMDYLNPLGNNLAYVMAVEKLLQIEIPERAQVIRVLMCELQRKECRSRSEEHTSELQSHLNLVCRLLLEKKKIEVVTVIR